MFEIEESRPEPRAPIRPVTVTPPPPPPSTRSFGIPAVRLIGRVMLTASTVLLFSAWMSAESFPEVADIDDALSEEPLQESTDRTAFDFDYRGETYTVEPVAEYRINGLIVSANNPSGWGDIYHDENSVDFRDLCVVWGGNTDKSLLERISFWSEPWTCHVKPKDFAAHQAFDYEALSNNHLLSDSDSVRRIIESAKVGDQIELSGMLVNYYVKGLRPFARRTSTVRSDTGNGACEVMFVEAARILKTGPRTRANLLALGKWGFVTSVVILLGLFFFAPLEKRS